MTKTPAPEPELEDVWYAGDYHERTEPLLTKRLKGLRWPGRDVDGREMYENTHFASEEAAWQNMLKNVRAMVSMASRDYRQAQERLRQVTEDLAKFAAHADDTERAHQERIRKRKAATS